MWKEGNPDEAVNELFVEAVELTGKAQTEEATEYMAFLNSRRRLVWILELFTTGGHDLCAVN